MRLGSTEVNVGNLAKITLITALIGTFSAPAIAQGADIGPTILVESMPSDNPKYRRMVYVRYLSGASYKAYNRREFNLATSPMSGMSMGECADGAATSLQEIKSFAKSEKRRARSGQAPETTAFCIKNVPNWAAENKDVYLDPIFEGMPYVAP
jgi:hypothetical protein